MAVENFTINKEVTMMEIGSKIKWMDLAFFTILMDLLLTKETGDKINLMAMELSIMISRESLIAILTLQTLISLMTNGSNMRESSRMMLKKGKAS